MLPLRTGPKSHKKDIHSSTRFLEQATPTKEQKRLRLQTKSGSMVQDPGWVSARCCSTHVIFAPRSSPAVPLRSTQITKPIPHLLAPRWFAKTHPCQGPTSRVPNECNIVSRNENGWETMPHYSCNTRLLFNVTPFVPKLIPVGIQKSDSITAQSFPQTFHDIIQLGRTRQARTQDAKNSNE